MSLITLHDLPINTFGKVHSLNCSSNVKRRLLDLGLIPNTPIKAILKSPFGDPIAYEIRGSIIALRSEDSELIICEK